jgi:hypothetical protein
VTAQLDSPARRILFAIAVSLLVHGLALWGPSISLPRFGSSLPPLIAKLEPLPAAAPKKAKRRPKAAAAKPPADQQPAAQEKSQPTQEETLAASAVAAASAAAAAEAMPSEAEKEVERTPLPKQAQLTFAINKGSGNFRIGEAIHTLEIEDGRYVLHAVTRTVGLVRLFKSYELTQYSSGSYDKYGLQPEQFFEQRADKLTTLRQTVEFDHDNQTARFSSGDERPLPPETLDILSVMYQFPPLAHTEMVSVSVTNGRKIERYDFEITAEERIQTALGELLTVRLHKMHAANEEGLDIWLAYEYRLFPVKMRFTEKNGEVAAEAIITDIRVSEENGVRKDAVD